MNILLVILLFGCAKPLLLDNIRLNVDKYFIYGGNNQRSFYFENVTVPDSFEVVWTNDLNGSQWATSITIMDDLIIASDLSGRIFAFDIKTGKNQGAIKYDGAIFHQPVIYKNKLHFVVNEEKEEYSTLIYYDFINSKILLEHRLEGNVRNELLLDDKFLYALTDMGVLHKYNPVGTEIYKTETDEICNSAPILVANNIVFTNIKGELLFIDSETGKINSRKKIANSIEGNLSSDGKNIFTGTTEGGMICVDVKSHEILWRRKLDSKIIAAPAVSDNQVVVGTLSGNVFSVNKITGDIIWEYESGGLINAAIFVGNNNVLVPDLNRKLHILDKMTGELKSISEFEGRVRTTPVFHDGIFYLGYDKGYITALRGVK